MAATRTHLLERVRTLHVDTKQEVFRAAFSGCPGGLGRVWVTVSAIRSRVARDRRGTGREPMLG